MFLSVLIQLCQKKLVIDKAIYLCNIKNLFCTYLLKMIKLQFESTDARHGFPCFDEPGLSASYTIRIEHHNSYTALCNMPVESRTVLVETEFVVTVFEKSPNFQTYLVAFIISDFHYIENLAARTPQQVYATPNQIAMGYGDFALDTGVEVLEALEKYLEVDYLLPKIDQVFIRRFIDA